MSQLNLLNFRDQHALVVHRRDQHFEALAAQLGRIGLTVTQHFPRGQPVASDADVVFFDAELSHPHLFDWAPRASKMPLIALLGSEAPGPLEHALALGPSAFMQKPIGSVGVYNALIVAHHKFRDFANLSDQIEDFTARVRARPVVIRAVITLMIAEGLTDTAAFERLRRRAMAAQKPLEVLAMELSSFSADAALSFRGTQDDEVTVAASSIPRAQHNLARKRRGH